MSQICGEPLTSRDGKCTNDATDEEGELKYADGKCGIHSEESEFPNRSTDAENPLIQKFIERKKDNKPNTYSSLRAGCMAFDAWLELEGIDPTEVVALDIEEFALYLKGQGKAESTVMQYVQNNVSAFYSYLVKESRRQSERGREGYGLAENPVHEADVSGQLEAPGMTEREKKLGGNEYFALSQDEMDLLIEHTQPPDRFRGQLIQKILGQCGLRPVELRSLKVDYVIDPKLWDNNRLKVKSTKTERYNGQKSGYRTVRYNDGLKFYLEKWLEGGYRESYKYANDSDYLFPSNRSPQISKSVVYDTVWDAAEAAGIQEVLYHDSQDRPRMKYSPYSYRHGFGTQMAAKGYPPSKLARLMGSDEETVSKYYVNHRESELDDAVEFVPEI